MAETLGQRIRRLRKAKRWTQWDLAAEAGVGRTAVAQWELGQKGQSVEKFALVADALEVTMNELFRGTDGNVLAGDASAPMAGGH